MEQVKQVVTNIGNTLLIYLIAAGVITNLVVLPKVLTNGSISIDNEVIYIKKGVRDDRE